MQNFINTIITRKCHWRFKKIITHSSFIKVQMLEGKIYLQHKEACMEDARVNESCTELSTLEKLIGFLEKEVVSIKHDHSVIVH